MQTENPKDPTPIQDFLQKSTFAKIVQQANQLLKIEQILEEILPEDFVAHCHVLNLKEGTLLIEVDNSAIATRLRYQEEEWIKRLYSFSECPLISRIQFQVRPNSR